MKTVLTLLIATICSISISIAQEKGSRQNRTPEERAKFQVEHLTKELELNKTQQDSIYHHFVLSGKAFQDQRKDMDHEKMRAAMQERNKKIKTFLTEEQNSKYEELQKRRSNRT